MLPRKSLYALLIFLLLAPAVFCASARDDFFSYDRFYESAGMINGLAAEKGTGGEIKAFADDFMSGVIALSQNDMDPARNCFLNARKEWPEYFWTDFILALIYEKSGDNRVAAKYYKSYLVKLKNFEQGKYKISGALIHALAGRNIESYGEAYARVKGHLAEEGINIDKVWAAPYFPLVFLVLGAVLLAAIAYFTMIRGAILWLKKWYRVTFPPSGFWGCGYCGHLSPDLSKTCHGCGRTRRTS